MREIDRVGVYVHRAVPHRSLKEENDDKPFNFF